MIDKCRNGHEIKRVDREYETARVHVRWCRCGTVRTDSTAKEAERAFLAAFGEPQVADEVDPGDLAAILDPLIPSAMKSCELLGAYNRLMGWLDRRRSKG